MRKWWQPTGGPKWTQPKRYMQTLAKGNDDTLQPECMYFEILNLLLHVNPKCAIGLVWWVHSFDSSFAYTNAQTLITRTQVGWWICLCAYILCVCINIRQLKTDKLEHKGHARDDVIKWKHFPCYWPFVRGIHRSPVNYPHKGQWRGALMFSLIFSWTNNWVNNRDACDFWRHRPHFNVIVMQQIGTPDPDNVICH